jgi:hypothetical protein
LDVWRRFDENGKNDMNGRRIKWEKKKNNRKEIKYL